MNVENPQRLAVRLGIVALSLLATGCSGTGSPLTANSNAVPAQAQTASTAAHSNQKLYISTVDGGSVVVYSAGSNPTLLQTITDGVPRPGGVWVDKRGVLYVVNVPDQSYQTSLPEYKADATTPFRTIMQGIVNCGTVGVDNKENVYVTGINPANASFFLEIYPKGSLSPSETLTIPHTGLGDPSGLAFDSSGALLVGESLFGRVSVVYRPSGLANLHELRVT